MSRRQDPPDKSEVVNIAATDHTVTAPYVAGIYCSAAGTVDALLRGDTVSFQYVVTAGQLLVGDFKKIIKATTTLTSAQMLLVINSPDGSA